MNQYTNFLLVDVDVSDIQRLKEVSDFDPEYLKTIAQMHELQFQLPIIISVNNILLDGHKRLRSLCQSCTTVKVLQLNKAFSNKQAWHFHRSINSRPDPTQKYFNKYKPSYIIKKQVEQQILNFSDPMASIAEHSGPIRNMLFAKFIRSKLHSIPTSMQFLAFQSLFTVLKSELNAHMESNKDED